MLINQKEVRKLLDSQEIPHDPNYFKKSFIFVPHCGNIGVLINSEKALQFVYLDETKPEELINFLFGMTPEISNDP